MGAGRRLLCLVIPKRALKPLQYVSRSLGKLGVAMQDPKIAEFRTEAAACRARAERDANKSTAARWLKVAEEWSRMADELERPIKPQT